MNMHTCPHCKELGVRAISRFLIGPATYARCNCCGRKVSVPWWSSVTLLPVIIAPALLSFLLEASVLTAVFSAVCGFVSCALWEVFVPLVRR